MLATGSDATQTLGKKTALQLATFVNGHYEFFFCKMAPWCTMGRGSKTFPVQGPKNGINI